MNTPRLPVSLHISFAPRDVRHAADTLPHQLRQIGSNVEEVTLTIDTRGRVRDTVGSQLAELEAVAARLSSAAPRYSVRLADYSQARRLEVSQTFLGDRLIPTEDYRGGPMYPYFDGWLATNQPYIFHLDSDMLIGGQPRTWMMEAMSLLDSEPTIFTCTPLAGPPRADFSLIQRSRREAKPRGAHAFDSFSTRIFFMARARLIPPRPRLALARANVSLQLRGWLERRSSYTPVEKMIGEHMQRLGQRRVDFLGEPPGCWSLHPPFRNAEFYRRLDELVKRVELGEVPDGQRGDYNVNDSLIDWSDARAANRWWRRLRRVIPLPVF